MAPVSDYLDGTTPEGAETKISDCPISFRNLGTMDQLEQILTENIVDEVLFALPKDYTGEVEKYVTLCEERGLTVKIALDLYDLNVAKTYVHSIGTIPVLTYHTVSLNDWQHFLKRCMDVVGALVGLLLTAEFSLFVIPAILLDSKGPVFFKQKRMGQNRRVFNSTSLVPCARMPKPRISCCKLKIA